MSQFRLNVWVKPGAKRTFVGGCHDGALVVSVSAPAVDGQANEAVIAALAAAFGVRSREIAIVTGLGSRSKVIDITGDASSLRAQFTALAVLS